jgi:hypothetical protein
MKKPLIVVIILIMSGLSAHSQLITYGIQIGSNYSHYSLSESASAIEVTKGSIGFHSGLFFRRDFEIFFIGADIRYSSYLGGTITDGTNSFNLRTGNVNMPILFGKKFYPGIKIFAGGMPSVFIKHNDNELQSFLENSPATQSSMNGSQHRNDFVFHMVAGAGYDFSKFFIELRYEHPLDYFIMEDFTTGGSSSGIDNYHYLAQFMISVGYWFN